MPTDIQIAQKTKLKSIAQIADKIAINPDELELYGNYKAKLKPELYQRIKTGKDAKLILVTAINPTPAGEGKTTTSIGLTMAMNRIKAKTVLAIREPSLGPCFGIKGGACGGGRAQVAPMEDINLHFTGDIHAITSANNLLSALIDNHIYHGNQLKLDPRQVLWKRAVDLNDRNLRQVVVGLGGKSQGFPREDGFNISVASEIMAILCLAQNLEDLKQRLKNILIGYTYQGRPIFASDLQAHKPLAVLLKDAIKPNLAQTLEHNPVLIHGGPFANIAHGCNSLIATRYGLKLADYLITEAGFGADLGAEKFFNIKCRIGQLKPDAVILVATIRSLKYNGGLSLSKITTPNLAKLKKGIVNLKKHIQNLKKFQIPVVVAINHFPFDSPAEVRYIRSYCADLKVPAAVSKVCAQGGAGGIELAETLLKTIKTNQTNFQPLYQTNTSLEKKIEKLARNIYGAGLVNYTAKARAQIAKLESDRMDKLPICVAKTQYSLSDDPNLLGSPQGFSVTVRELRISHGAGFVVVLLGDVMTMPGLPAKPAAENIDLNSKGSICGLF
ncbi:MAG: formate--tetrahydrofolate ligase [Candidatus Moranbacteria bacterium]|nr:formate--tetrahydrofolate ligase [Candidatus Moranbacteria bacterium]